MTVAYKKWLQFFLCLFCNHTANNIVLLKVKDKTDQEIISTVLAGNTNAYQLIVSRYSNLIFTLVYNILQNRQDAEEIAQDVFVKAYTALAGFKYKSLFSTWLYRIAVNTALNKKKIKRFTVLPAENHLQDEQEHVHDLLALQANSERKKFVQLALQHLKDDERICITMFYLCELQVSEIHALTQISVANIKVLLHRGRKNLYRALEHLLKTEIKSLT